MGTRMGLIVFSLLALGVSLAGCKHGSGDNLWYTNRAAAASTLEKPVQGSPDERTFVDESIKGKGLKVVFVAPVKVSATTKGDETARFMAKFAAVAETGAKQALVQSDRIDRLSGNADEADTLVSLEALIHISTLDGRVVNDPVMKDPQSKAFLIYSITDAKSGKLLLRHTGTLISQWEYAPMAMDDLEMTGKALARDFLYLLERY